MDYPDNLGGKLENIIKINNLADPINIKTLENS